MKIKKASLNDLSCVREFYYDLIDRTPDMGKYAQWKKDIHPDDTDLERYLNDDAMYMLIDDGRDIGKTDVDKTCAGRAEDGKTCIGQNDAAKIYAGQSVAEKKSCGQQADEKIAGMMAVELMQDEEYRGISWQIEASDSEVAEVHLLAVSPDHQKQGVGRHLIEEAQSIARSNGKKALRLDAIETNTPAQHMYESGGFRYSGRQRLYAGNTGWIEFLYYEYLL